MSRKKPYDPRRDKVPAHIATQLGLPTRERHAKSNGFEVDVLVDGEVPLVRSRQKSMITLPSVRQSLIEDAIKDLQSRGVFDLADVDIKIRDTASDRLLSAVEHQAISWFITIHAKVQAGRARITDYLGSPRSQDRGKAPYSREEGKDRATHAYISDRLPEAHLMFLDWLAWNVFPGMRDGTPPSEVDIGKQIIDSRDARRAQGGVEGFLRAVSQSIAHWRMEHETFARRRSLVQQEIVDNMKKVAY
jgi:hypothetical protein